MREFGNCLVLGVLDGAVSWLGTPGIIPGMRASSERLDGFLTGAVISPACHPRAKGLGTAISTS